MNSRRFEGQVAWISGATSGIGEAAAHLFADEGAKVALIGRREAHGRRIAENIRQRGGRAIAFGCDVRSEAAVRDSIDRTAAEFGGLNILVNNAGIVEVKMLHDYAEEDWDYVMAVNVKSILYFSCEDSSGITGTSLTIDCGYLTAAEWRHPGKTAFQDESEHAT